MSAPSPDNATHRSPGPVRGGTGASGRERLLAAGVGLGLLTVLSLAAWLQPDGRGHGTHEQLGFLPGMQACRWAATLEAPCPTCGMTTSFAWAAEGEFATAFATQPFGALLSLAAATGFWMCLHVAITGSRLGRMAGLLLRPAALWTAGGLLIAAWAYKAWIWSG